MGLIRLLAVAAASIGAAAIPPLPAISSISPIAAVRSDGRNLIAYEIRLSSDAPAPRSLTIVDADTDSTIARFDARQLAKRIGSAPNGDRLIYVEAAVTPENLPKRLSHRLTWPDGAETTLPPRAVDHRPTVLAPPLGGGPWVAVHSPEWARGHRRVARDNGAIPGRFAIDWVAVDDAGRTSRGDADRPTDTLGYAVPVLAGADAIVAAVRDGMAEHPSIAANPAHRLEDSAGNYVALRLPDGRHVFYEHLKPGSIRVRPGQRVASGVPIGALGFTGDSTGPHLHMHVAAGPDPIRDEGVPFVISDYVELGRYVAPGMPGRERWVDARPVVRIREWPGSNVVVRFAPFGLRINDRFRIGVRSAVIGSNFVARLSPRSECDPPTASRSARSRSNKTDRA